MSKTKNMTGQTLHSPKQVMQNAMKLLRETCDQMVGEGHFKKFSEICQLKMVSNRVPTLKFKLSLDSEISTADLIMYNDILAGQTKGILIETVTGSRMSLSNYLREGILLINYVEVMEDDRLTHYQELKALVAPYSRQNKLFTSCLTELVQLLFRMSTLCSNYQEKMFSFVYSAKPSVTARVPLKASFTLVPLNT